MKKILLKENYKVFTALEFMQNYKEMSLNCKIQSISYDVGRVETYQEGLFKDPVEIETYHVKTSPDHISFKGCSLINSHEGTCFFEFCNLNLDDIILVNNLGFIYSMPKDDYEKWEKRWEVK